MSFCANAISAANSAVSAPMIATAAIAVGDITSRNERRQKR